MDKLEQGTMPQEQGVKEGALDTLRSEFDRLKADQVQHPATRRVRLRYRSCCGCGCDWISLYREVPWDSDLKDGDKTEQFLSTDKTDD